MSRSYCGSLAAQLGERFLEVTQIGHEDLEIALGLEHAPLDQRHQVVRAGRRLLAPEFAPFLFGCPQRKGRSEEHTSELQSPDHLVCRLLLEKKKAQKIV